MGEFGSVCEFRSVLPHPELQLAIAKKEVDTPMSSDISGCM